MLQKFHKQVPRYTSYPPAPFWHDLDPDIYSEKLHTLPNHPLSLYFHIPFCHSMCLFCGCSVILNRNPEKEENYVTLLIKEIDLVTSYLKKKYPVTQLHFGGGTPTKLSEALLKKLFHKITASFHLDLCSEIAIEVDPRTVFADQGKKLRFLKELGFNRVSFGVQDTNPIVQEAIKRRQPKEMSEMTFHLARELHFKEINIDLIYGLPHQTTATFAETVNAILNLKPDRIALFSYAKVPWLKAHQKAIPDHTLPSVEEKFAIYTHAREAFISAGYIPIGMDHFALPASDLAKSYHHKTLHRNFQGYTSLPTPDMLGFGVTAIGCLQDTYIQNHKDLKVYEEAIERNCLPVFRGKVLECEDLVRKWVIQKVMCTFEVNKKEFCNKFHLNFDTYFNLDLTEFEGLVENQQDRFVVTKWGELFVRNIAALFDAYQHKSSTQFSQSI